jgi:hypothetical protein
MNSQCELCEASYAGLGGEGKCEKCDEEREFATESGSAVCELSPPGFMPNDDRTGVLKCPSGTYAIDCSCPRGTFLISEECKTLPEGVVDEEGGITLESLPLSPGWWRTNELSEDVRKCPLEEACVGGNASHLYCREGSTGPYCYLCSEGFTKDAFGICQACSNEVGDVLLGVGLILLYVLLFVLLYAMLHRFVLKKNEALRKSLKTGLKIIFVATQILAGLPVVIPAIALPKNYKAFLTTVQPVGLDAFELMGVGCWGSGWNLNWNLLGVTMLPIAVCVVLCLMRQTDAAIAVTFLVVTAATTTIFKVFPCDEFDNGDVYLRADYSIRCDSGQQAWALYGILMILVYPVGVLCLYSGLLWRNKARIRESVDVRARDEALKGMAFLFDSYKPEFWWFEVFETSRRLAMTGILGAIAPGSDSQLAAGMLMSVGGAIIYGIAWPFLETKDNFLAVLANVEIYCVLLTSMVMKHGGAGSDAEGVGGMLIALHVVCVAVVLIYGITTCFKIKEDAEDGKASENGIALRVLKSGIRSMRSTGSSATSRASTSTVSASSKGSTGTDGGGSNANGSVLNFSNVYGNGGRQGSVDEEEEDEPAARATEVNPMALKKDLV